MASRRTIILDRKGKQNFEVVRFQYVRRESNQVVDQLANLAIEEGPNTQVNRHPSNPWEEGN